MVDIEFVSCDRCGHIYDALDSSEAMRRLVTQDIPWFVQVSPGQIALARDVANWIGPEKIRNKNVLEIGGASCALTRGLANEARQVTSIEPNKGFNRNSDSNITYIEGLFPNDVPQEKFDLIVCQQVILQVPDPRGFLTAMKNYLSEDGCIYISTESAEVVANSASLNTFSFQSQHIFPQTAMKTLLENVGFSIIARQNAGKNFRIIATPAEVVPIEKALAPYPGYMRDLPERLEINYQKGAEALKNIKGPIALYGATAGTQSFLGLYPDIDEIVVAFDDTPEFEGLEIPRNGPSIPIAKVTTDTLSHIDNVIVCCFQHDAVIKEKLENCGFQGNIYSIRHEKRSGDPARPASLFQ